MRILESAKISGSIFIHKTGTKINRVKLQDASEKAKWLGGFHPKRSKLTHILLSSLSFAQDVLQLVVYNRFNFSRISMQNIQMMPDVWVMAEPLKLEYRQPICQSTDKCAPLTTACTTHSCSFPPPGGRKGISSSLLAMTIP